MQAMKLRLKGAQKGHSLLKKKADALTVRFRQILLKIVEVCAFKFRSRETTGISARIQEKLGFLSK